MPIWSQGNVELYSREKLCARRITRQDDRLIPSVEMWWQLASTHELTATGDLVEPGRITFDEYVAINMRFYKLLVEPYDEAEARASAEEDWRNDTKNSGVMDFPTFFASMTEMADQWTNTTDVDEYVQFLHYMWDDLTVEDEETGEFHWIGWKPMKKAKQPRRKSKSKKRAKPVDISRLYARPSGVPDKPAPKKPTVPVGPKRRLIAKALPPEIPPLPTAVMRSQLVQGGLLVLTRQTKLPPAGPPAVSHVVIGLEDDRPASEAMSPICITGENVGAAEAIDIFDKRIAMGTHELRVVNATTLCLILPRAVVEKHADRPFQGVAVVIGAEITEQEPHTTHAPTIIMRPRITDVRLVNDVLGNAVIHGEWFQRDELVVLVGGHALDAASVFLVDECTIACDLPASLCNNGEPVRVVVAVCGIPSRSVLCRLVVAERSRPSSRAATEQPTSSRLPAVSRAADEPEWHPLPAFMPIESYRQQPVRQERPISPSRAPNDLRRAIRPERRAALDVRRPASAVHRRRGVLRSTWSYNTERVPTYRREHFKTARERHIISSEAHVRVPGDDAYGSHMDALSRSTRALATQILDFDETL